MLRRRRTDQTILQLLLEFYNLSAERKLTLLVFSVYRHVTAVMF